MTIDKTSLKWLAAMAGILLAAAPTLASAAYIKSYTDKNGLYVPGHFTSWQAPVKSVVIDPYSGRPQAAMSGSYNPYSYQPHVSPGLYSNLKKTHSSATCTVAYGC